MRTYVDIVFNAMALMFLFPLVIYSIAHGSRVPKGSWFEKYWEAEKSLGLVGNQFLLICGVFGFSKLALDFGLIDKSTQDTVTHVIAVPFMLLCFLCIRLWVRAWRKIHQSEDEQS